MLFSPASWLSQKCNTETSESWERGRGDFSKLAKLRVFQAKDLVDLMREVGMHGNMAQKTLGFMRARHGSWGAMAG